VRDLVTRPAPERIIGDSAVAGEVVTVDRFGNVQLAITAADAAQIGVMPGGSLLAQYAQLRLSVPYREMFGAVEPGELLAFLDRARLVSLAVNGGNAAQRLGLAQRRGVSITAVPQSIRP
jgi:S-adenosylmethionine hydrolase